MNAEDVINRYVELYNDAEPGTYGSDRVLELYAPDCRWRESPTQWMPEGRTGDLNTLREAMKLSQSLFVDRKIVVHEVVANGDRGVMRYTWSATTTVDMGPGLAPAGAQPTVEVAAFIRVAEGKIVEITELLGAASW